MHLPVSDTTSTLNRLNKLTSTHTRHKTSWATILWPETSISNNNKTWGMITRGLRFLRLFSSSIRIWVINLSTVISINYNITSRISPPPQSEAGLEAMSTSDRRTLMHFKISSNGLRFTSHRNRHSRDTAKTHIRILTNMAAEFKILIKYLTTKSSKLHRSSQFLEMALELLFGSGGKEKKCRTSTTCLSSSRMRSKKPRAVVFSRGIQRIFGCRIPWGGDLVGRITSKISEEAL